jgi:hypothetical protein
MRSRTPLVLALAVLGLTLGCRDEQAGPKRRATTAPPPSAQGRTLEAAPSDLTYLSEATLGGGAIRYLGSKVEPEQPRAGQPVRLSHYFVALRPPPAGWSFFTHLVDPATFAMLVNADHPVQGGAMPLERWPVGKVIEDQHTVAMPQTEARVLLGFWRGDQRLPVDQPQAHDGSHRLLGPKLGGTQQASLPEYRVPRTETPPTIDGDLSDEVWRRAPAVNLVGSMRGEKPRLRTTARLLYDDANLYVAFDAEDPDVWGTLMNRDDPIYGEEVVEIFIDANADGRTYNEMQVSPNNVVFDAYFPAPRQGMDLAWDSKLQSAVQVRGTINDPSDRDDGWSAELRIPFSELAEVPRLPPQPGDRWRFNLYRLDLPDRKRQEGQAFSPLFVPDFHATHRFGWLVFE